MAVVTKINAASRVSVKLGDSFYTMEYGEERTLSENDDYGAEKEKLWETVNDEVDRQVTQVVNWYRESNKR